MALAVVFLACQAATPKAGDRGPAGAPGEPGGVPPILDTPIPDMSLTESGAGATDTINLDDHFIDPDGEEGEMLTYTPSSSDEDEEVVTVTVSGSNLTITAAGPGMATITVRVADSDGLRGASDRFDVTVSETGAPTVATPIPDMDLYKDDGAKTVTLGDHFTHTSDITYTATSSPEGRVTLAIAEGVLTITPEERGTGIIVTVTATADNKMATDAFVVDVMDGSKLTPDPEPMPDAPMATGTIMAQTVEAEKSTEPMDVSTYFTPATGLTYTPMSSDTAKATANIPEGTSNLTITGVAEGSATVTVTATNSAGTAMQTISVTVTAAMAPHKPPTRMIDGVGETAEVTIDPGETLQPVDPGIVSAAPKSDSANVWTLTGKKKGTTDVRIMNANRRITGTIKVTVGNSKPVVVKAQVPSTIQQLIAGNTIVAEEIVDDKGMAVVIAPGKRGYHKLDVAFGTIFSDPDGDIKEYMAVSHEPYVKVVHKTATLVVLDVRKKIGTTFPLEVYVVDEEGLMSDKVMLSVETVNPLGDIYEVEQHLHARNLTVKGGKVYRREGVDHELRFKEDTAGSEGFRFVREYRAGFATGFIGADAVAATPTVKSTDDPLTVGSTAHYGITVTSGKLKSMPVLSFDATGGTGDNEPKLLFQVTGSGAASVAFTYNAVVGSSTDDDPATAEEFAYDKFPPKATVSMNIVSES